MSRQVLKGLVGAMLALLILGFGFILFSGLNLNESTGTEAELFEDVVNGATVLRRHKSERVWVTRLNQEQRNRLEELDGFVHNPNSGCSSDNQLCILLADSLHDGLDLSYTKSRPPQIPHDIPWVGGFVDPATGATFDLLGRAYKLTITDGRTFLPTIEL